MGAHGSLAFWWNHAARAARRGAQWGPAAKTPPSQNPRILDVQLHGNAHKFGFRRGGVPVAWIAVGRRGVIDA
jgi:hypothetical protein